MAQNSTIKTLIGTVKNVKRDFFFELKHKIACYHRHTEHNNCSGFKFSLPVQKTSSISNSKLSSAVNLENFYLIAPIFGGCTGKGLRWLKIIFAVLSESEIEVFLVAV